MFIKIFQKVLSFTHNLSGILLIFTVNVRQTVMQIVWMFIEFCPDLLKNINTIVEKVYTFTNFAVNDRIKILVVPIK